MSKRTEKLHDFGLVVASVLAGLHCVDALEIVRQVRQRPDLILLFHPLSEMSWLLSGNIMKRYSLSDFDCMITQAEMDEWSSYMLKSPEIAEMIKITSELDMLHVMVEARIANRGDYDEFRKLVQREKELHDIVFKLAKDWYGRLLKRRKGEEEVEPEKKAAKPV